MVDRTAFRDDWDENYQHLLGRALFVSPVVTADTVKEVVFPRTGRWIDYWDEASVTDSGARVRYAAPLGREPIFVRAGAVIPMAVTSDVTEHGDATAAGRTTLAIYPDGVSRTTLHLPTGAGTGYTDVRVTVDERRGEIDVAGARSAAYRLRVKAFAAPCGVTGVETWRYDAARRVIVADVRGSQLRIRVDGLVAYGSRRRRSAGAGPVRQRGPSAHSPLPSPGGEP